MPETVPTEMLPTRLWTKRLFDIVGSCVALLVLLPVIIVISLIVLWRDGRPVLHCANRLGRGGVPFRLLKFRTLQTGTESQSTFAPDDDPRITKLGRWLRRWRLDEFPQLLNVLTGDMSLVGPRPMPSEHAEMLPEHQRLELLSVRPGLTDPAAVQFLAEDAVLSGHRDAESIYREKLLPVKAELQLRYIRQWTLLQDLRVVFATVSLLWSPTHRRRSAQALQHLLDT